MPSYVGPDLTFDLVAGEAVRDRVLRCCGAALDAGPLGRAQRHDVYRDFISCRDEESLAKAEALTSVKTSCALFIRAIRRWCGAPSTGPYRPGTGMFVSMGGVSTSHRSFRPYAAGAVPRPGDIFYIATKGGSANDGHTGIFVAELSPGRWRTAEGGGPPDGTTCRFNERGLTATGFEHEGRPLWGWFDIEQNGLPASPSAAEVSPVQQRYDQIGGATTFGPPLGPDQVRADGRGRSQDYELGSIYWTPETGAFEVHGLIRDRYQQLGGPDSILGYPVSDEVDGRGGTGRSSWFEHGILAWSDRTGAWEVYGAISVLWDSEGGEGGSLGYPCGCERDHEDQVGRVQDFEGGSVYWSAQNGAVLLPLVVS